MTEKEHLQTTKKKEPSPWLKKLGKYGFLFFLIKGLIWLALAGAAYFGFFKN